MAQDGKRILCLCHFGGERNVNPENNSMNYVGGKSSGVLVTQDTRYDEFIGAACDALRIHPESKTFYYSIAYDKTRFLRLDSQSQLDIVLEYNESIADVFVVEEEGAPSPIVTVSPRTIVGSNTSSQATACEPGVISPTIDGETSLVASNSAGLNRPLSKHIYRDVIIGEGQTFETPDKFRNAVSLHAIGNHFCYKFKHNKPTYMCACCTVVDCPWKVSAGCKRNLSLVTVKRFVNVHTHTTQDQVDCRPKVRSKVVARLVEEKIRDNPSYLPRQICKDFQTNFGIPMTYKQSWRGKELAKYNIEARPENSYKLIPWMCERLKEAIPGTVAEWTCSEPHRQFKQLFVAYGCSIHGFRNGCRPLLFIDGTHLSGPNKGTLLGVSALDANNSVYPLAYAWVALESDEDWLWFLRHLKTIVGEREVVIVSDKNSSIIAGVDEVFAMKYHAHCFRHLTENFSKEINKKKDELRMTKNGKDVARQLLNEIAYARTPQLYDRALRKMAAFCPDLEEWVIGNGPEHWSNALFGAKRWDWMNSNIAESFNSWLQEERQFTILSFINKHREKLSNKLFNEQLEVEKWDILVGPRIDERIKVNQYKAMDWPFRVMSPTKVEVHDGDGGFHVVDLEAKSCTCFEWDQTGIPCPHACCAITALRLNICEYVDDCYKKEVQQKIYETIMSAVPTHDMPTPEEVSAYGLSIALEDIEEITDILPRKRLAGRPKKKHIESQFMDKRPVTCSRCKRVGHNRSSCKEPSPCD